MAYSCLPTAWVVTLLLASASWAGPQWQSPGSVAERAHRPGIYVLAGTNGAGKSSLIGAMFEQAGEEYFNPDTAARRILAANPGTTPSQANSAAWYQGKRLLEQAIAHRLRFALETTLGGKTITALLETAVAAGIDDGGHVVAGDIHRKVRKARLGAGVLPAAGDELPAGAGGDWRGGFPPAILL